MSISPHGFMPGVHHEPIPAGDSDPVIDPCGVIQHIAVSNTDDLHGQFSNDGGIESHFYIRKDGTIFQYRSIFREADAQFDGNSFGSPRRGFISVEHQGGVGADLNVGMPQVQLDAFHRVVLWVHSQRPFRLRVCPAWNAEGVGYHALFEEWNHNHHSCPGPGRIKQFNTVTLPWLASVAKPPKPKPPVVPEDPFDVSVLSGRFDKTDPRVATAWQGERDRGASLLLGTELAGRDHDTLVGPDGVRDKRYATLHAETGGPKGENAVQYAKKDWTLEESRLLRVWDGGGPGRFAHPSYALVSVLQNRHVDRELVDIQNHDPAHLFAGSKFFNPGNLVRWVKVRNREARLMRQLRAEHPGAAFMLSGDPNASGTFLARYMAKHFQGFRAANKFRFGAAWVSGLRRVGPVESVPTPSSDHPIQRIRLGWVKTKRSK